MAVTLRDLSFGDSCGSNIARFVILRQLWALRVFSVVVLATACRVVFVT